MSKTNQRKLSAIASGRNARRSGNLKSDNPHSRKSANHYLWYTGWRDQEEYDYKKNAKIVLRRSELNMKPLTT